MISELRMNKVTAIRLWDPNLMLAGLDDEEMAAQRPARARPERGWGALQQLKHLGALVPRSGSAAARSGRRGSCTGGAPSVVFTTRRVLQLLDTTLNARRSMAIDLMEREGRPGLGRGTGAAYEVRPGLLVGAA